MEYFMAVRRNGQLDLGFVQRFFQAHPDALALRLSLVEKEGKNWKESNILWHTKNSSIAFRIANLMGNRVLRKACQLHANQTTNSLLSDKSTSRERLLIDQVIDPDGTHNKCFIEKSSGQEKYWTSYEVEKIKNYNPEEDIAEQQGELYNEGQNVYIVFAGHQQGVDFSCSVWLMAAMEKDNLCEETLFRYLTRYYPFYIEGAHFRYLAKELGFKYHIGLPELQKYHEGEAHKVFNGNSASLTKYWLDRVSKDSELLEIIKNRFTFLFQALGDTESAKVLSSWLELKRDELGQPEDKFTIVVLAIKGMMNPTRVWLPFIYHIAKHANNGLSNFADNDNPMLRYSRIYVSSNKDGAVGYLIQGLSKLKKALDQQEMDIVYLSNAKIIQICFFLSGMDESFANDKKCAYEKIKEAHNPVPEGAGDARPARHYTDIEDALRDIVGPNRSNNSMTIEKRKVCHESGERYELHLSIELQIDDIR